MSWHVVPCSFLGRLCEMLYLLRLDEKQKAVVKLRQLTDTFFVDWLGNNLGYLMDPNCQLTPLGKVWGREEGGRGIIILLCNAAVT